MSEPVKPVEPVPADPAKPAEPVTPVPAEPVKTPEPEHAKPAEPAQADPAKPAEEIKYELKIPENSILDAAVVEQVSLFAKENKLSNEQAQAILERENSAAQAGLEAEHSKMKERVESFKAKCLEDSKADPEIGGDKFKETALLANDALDKLFPGDEIRKIMDDSGLGNHPTVLKGFAKIGRMLQDPKIHQPGTAPAPKTSMTSRLYDNPTSPKS